MADMLKSFFSQYWHLVLIFGGMSVAMFLLLRLQVMLRSSMEATITRLLRTDPALCLERLDNNKRLRWLFRKSLLLLWRLDCYLALGEDGMVRQTIGKLRESKLEPQDKVELYQREVSFFALSGDGERAKKGRDDLRSFLEEAKAGEDPHYSAIMEEADLIIGVYVDRNTGLIRKLIGRAEHTKNSIMRGVTQYRVAKLAWFKGDLELMNTYLNRAEKNLKDTWYAPVIAAAREDPRILESK